MAQLQQLRQMAQMMRGQTPQQLLHNFAARNPQFAEFLRQNQGKPPEQIAAERGIDMDLVRQILR
jgi:oligoendopeptidase F